VERLGTHEEKVVYNMWALLIQVFSVLFNLVTWAMCLWWWLPSTLRSRVGVAVVLLLLLGRKDPPEGQF